jgi:hypothetical protein
MHEGVKDDGVLEEVEVFHPFLFWLRYLVVNKLRPAEQSSLHRIGRCRGKE